MTRRRQGLGYLRRSVLASVAALLFVVGDQQSAAAAATAGHGASPAPTCGGEVPPPAQAGYQWTCSFDDEFDASTGDASSLNRSWWGPQVSTQSGFTTGLLGLTPTCYEDSKNNIWISGGTLHLSVVRQPFPFFCGPLLTQYTGGMVSTLGRFSQTYGRFEVRALLPQTTVAGLQETLWLWPVNGTRYGSWPASGEIDFAEFFSEYYWLDVPTIHYLDDPTTSNPQTDTNVATSDSCPIKRTQYNDYAVVWQPGRLQITINGTTCLIDNYQPSNVRSPAPFDQPFFIVLTQGLGIESNAVNFLTPLPATMSIDYVRAWQQVKSGCPTTGTTAQVPARPVVHHRPGRGAGTRAHCRGSRKCRVHRAPPPRPAPKVPCSPG